MTLNDAAIDRIFNRPACRNKYRIGDSYCAFGSISLELGAIVYPDGVMSWFGSYPWDTLNSLISQVAKLNDNQAEPLEIARKKAIYHGLSRLQELGIIKIESELYREFAAEFSKIKGGAVVGC